MRPSTPELYPAGSFFRFFYCLHFPPPSGRGVRGEGLSKFNKRTIKETDYASMDTGTTRPPGRSHPALGAVEEIHRPAYRRRQGKVKNERQQAWHALRGLPHAAQ